MKVKNITELQNAINQQIKKALALTYNDISELLQKYIDAYYDDLDPELYERTYMLRDNSLIDLDIKKVGNKYIFKVGFSDEYLTYKYPNQLGTDLPATGSDVIRWNNKSGTHGGTAMGNEQIKIWDEFIQELNGRQGITDLMKKNLRLCGLKVE